MRWRNFKKNLDLVLFTTDTHSVNTALCVDIRNIITHNRGIVNRFFIQRNARFAEDLGKRVVLDEQDRRDMLGTLGYCARQLDLRAIWGGPPWSRLTAPSGSFARFREVPNRTLSSLNTALPRTFQAERYTRCTSPDDRDRRK